MIDVPLNMDPLEFARLQRSLLVSDQWPKQEKALTRRRYNAWLAANHLHERWERSQQTVISRKRISTRSGPYELVALVSTAGTSWGGA